jgi:hypothetical protein
LKGGNITKEAMGELIMIQFKDQIKVKVPTLQENKVFFPEKNVKRYPKWPMFDLTKVPLGQVVLDLTILIKSFWLVLFFIF